MGIYYKQFDLDRNNTFVSYLLDFEDDKFTFTLRWNDYCDCIFLAIQDLNGNYLLSGRALVNNLTIIHKDLPYPLVFTHINNANYEPTIDNIDEFGLFYDDGREE